MIALIDNYDSFTYNLVQVLGALDAGLDIRVFRNDQITPDELGSLNPSHVVISPGPGSPLDAGVSNDVIRKFAGKTPLLGVCLGHQCLAHVFGGEVVRARRLVHGKTSLIRHDNQRIFAGVSNPFAATRYHSLLVNPARIPAGFVVCAACDDDPNEVMGMRHERWAVFGVQFHPESFLTVEGPRLLANFLAIR
ncbi:MAG: aminodeoxychorismate/anthranilate synthase component II [Planctomycetes bacterium]|nr:aminodeoxychorismate/anthranilate synthase component II [Planctomycetota bacterium]